MNCRVSKAFLGPSFYLLVTSLIASTALATELDLVSPLVTPVTELECQKCCRDALENFNTRHLIEVDSLQPSLRLERSLTKQFDVSYCVNQGCTFSKVDEPGFPVRCSELTKDKTEAERNGCELGRDFRFLGITGLLHDFHQCRSPGVIEHVEVDTNFPVDNPKVSGEECESCCDTMDKTFDDGTPGDLDRSTCKSRCFSGELCFADANHRERLACAVARDFLTEGTATLRANKFLCINGVLTPAPSDSSLSPTREPTRSTVISPIPSATPTTIPSETTLSPTSRPTESEEGENEGPETESPKPAGDDDNTLIIIIAFSIGGTLMFAGILLMLWRRRQRQSQGLKTHYDPTFSEDAYASTSNSDQNNAYAARSSLNHESQTGEEPSQAPRPVPIDGSNNPPSEIPRKKKSKPLSMFKRMIGLKSKGDKVSSFNSFIRISGFSEDESTNKGSQLTTANTLHGSAGSASEFGF